MNNFDDPIVNYVWMQFDANNETRPVPSHLFYNVQQNAKLYPRTKFRVWVEDPAAIAPYRIPDNVEVCSLNNASGFEDIPLMQEKGVQYGWAKVDIARLLVIKHIIEHEKRPALYSDMDIKDVELGSGELNARLDKHGVVFGASYTEEQGARVIHKDYENGYAAFRPCAADLLNRMIEAGKEEANLMSQRLTEPEESRDYVDTRNSVFQATRDVIIAWAATKGITDWRKELAGFPIQPPPRTNSDKGQRAELR